MNEPNPDEKKMEAHLIAKGWARVTGERPRFLDPHRPGSSDLGLNLAYRLQRDYERLAEGKPLYLVRPNHYGYGSEIVRYTDPRKRDGPVVARGNPDAIGTIYERLLNGGQRTPADLRDDTNYNKILVFGEKHGDRYFAAPTLEKFYDVCLAVVEQRNADGYWYQYEDAPVAAPSLTKEQTDGLPAGPVKRAALEEISTFEAAKRARLEQQGEQEHLRLALAGDGPAAAAFLRERHGGEYEGFDHVTLETA